MRHLALLSLIIALLLAAPLAHAASKHDRNAVAVRAHLRAGLQGLVSVCKQTSPARKLDVTDRALTRLHRAHALHRLSAASTERALRRTIESGIIAALNLKTRVHLERGSIERARRLNDAALSYPTVSVTALKLRIEIKKALLVDIYERIDGRCGIDRLRTRHDDIGAPIRDRGAARRR